MTFVRRNNLSVYSGVNNVISDIVMPRSGQHTSSWDLAVLVCRYCWYCEEQALFVQRVWTAVRRRRPVIDSLADCITCKSKLVSNRGSSPPVPDDSC